MLFEMIVFFLFSFKFCVAKKLNGLMPQPNFFDHWVLESNSTIESDLKPNCIPILEPFCFLLFTTTLFS